MLLGRQARCRGSASDCLWPEPTAQSADTAAVVWNMPPAPLRKRLHFAQVLANRTPQASLSRSRRVVSHRAALATLQLPPRIFHRAALVLVVSVVAVVTADEAPATLRLQLAASSVVRARRRWCWCWWVWRALPFHGPSVLYSTTTEKLIYIRR